MKPLTFKRLLKESPQDKAIHNLIETGVSSLHKLDELEKETTKNEPFDTHSS